MDSIEVNWLRLAEVSPLVGHSLAEANLRARTGASVIAIKRGGQLIPNPKSMTVFQPGDRIGLIGDRDQIEAAERVVNLTDIKRFDTSFQE
jgi:CPA2 family monovalent cation:H+ antiporter-2